jgi:hypothetical protein
VNLTQLLILILSLIFIVIIAFSLIKFTKGNKKSKQSATKKPIAKVYLPLDNRLVYFLVIIFFISVFSLIFLLKITLISFLSLFAVIGFVITANIIFLKKKYKIKTIHDIVWLALIVGIGQITFFLWLNFFPISHHFEQYKIKKVIMESESGATTIVLEDNIYDEYFYLRTFEGKDIPHGDSIEFKFKDGLLGFKIYESHIFY